MDKPIWDNDYTYEGIETVRMSCHAGDNSARAFCNLIGDQPLFYIDNIDENEEDFLSFETASPFPTDEKFLSAMRAKLDAYEKTAKTLSKIKMESSEAVFDKAFLEKDQTPTSLDELLNYCHQSGLFNAYYNKIKSAHVNIIHSDDVPTAEYNRNTKTILLNSRLNLKLAAKSLVRAMRTAWHHLNGGLLNPLFFQPEEAILINRLMEADADITIAAFLWDMKLAGDIDIWNDAMTGMDYDICTAYAMEAMTDFRAIKSGLAHRAAFEKWFMSGRCKSHDRDIIQIMMGDHTNIHISDEASSRVIAMDIIAAIGKQPTGQNYLTPILTNIMNDPIFGEVRDRSNANFLWFITFERRVNAMEEEKENATKKPSPDNIIKISPTVNQSETKKTDNTIASVFFLDHFRAG